MNARPDLAGTRYVMVAESLACPGCGDTVPPGRLSCPHCGEVLAAVAPRVVTNPFARLPAPDPLPTPEPLLATESEPLMAPEAPVAPEPLPAPEALLPRESEPLRTPSWLDRSASNPRPAPEPAPTFAPSFAPASAPTPFAPFAPEPLVAAVEDEAEDDDEPPTLEPEPELYARWPPRPAGTAAAAELQVVAPPAAPPPPPVPAAAAPAASLFAAPGAYVAPVPDAHVPPVPEAMQPVDEALPVAAALAAEPAAQTDPPPAAVFPRAWDPAGAAAGEGVMAVAIPGTLTRRIALPNIDREKVEEVADAMMLIGAFGLVLAFLAPWARVVIGSRGTGYMDTWGLAGSGHIALFLLVLGVLALAVFHNPIGRWLRTGVLGVAIGAFVFGLAWPYVVGPLGAGPGAMLAWVSGLVMCVAGMVSLLVLRHAALPPDV